MKPLHGIVLLLGIWLGAPAAQGAGFRQLYDAALAHDPGFRAARQKRCNSRAMLPAGFGQRAVGQADNLDLTLGKGRMCRVDGGVDETDPGGHAAAGEA